MLVKNKDHCLAEYKTTAAKKMYCTTKEVDIKVNADLVPENRSAKIRRDTINK
jgi:hypothetical protein